MAHPTPDSLALIALGEDVEPETTEHVGACRACFAEVEALQQVVAVGRSLGPEDRLTAPHPRVWARLAEELQDRQASPEGAPAVASTTDDLATRRGRRSPRWATVAVAASAALVVGLTGGYVLKGLVPSAAPVSATAQLNALPRWAGATGTATVEEGDGGQRTLVVTMELAPTTDVDGTLEVWMSDTRAEDMLPMGTATNGLTARFPIPASVDLAAHPIVDVSLEPRDDSDPTHSDISVVRGRLPV
ncbi:MAG: anti-sigma factor [Janthinobacterium lividum]